MYRLGVEGLQAFTARHGVRLRRAKAEQLHRAATDALRLPSAERELVVLQFSPRI
jgi:hypothetical protein